MKRSLSFLDEIIEKAKYDSYIESSKCGAQFENFYLFNLKVLRELMEEEQETLNEK